MGTMQVTMIDENKYAETMTDVVLPALEPVSYTHLTLPTIEPV